MTSLQRRLGSGLAVSLILLLSLIAWAVDLGTDLLMDSIIATRLDHDSELLLSELKISRQGLPIVRPRHVPPIYEPPRSGHYYRIEVDGHVLRSPSMDGSDLLPAAQPGHDRRIEEIEGPDDLYLLLFFRDMEWQGRRLRMVVAEDLHPFEEAAEEFITLFAWAAGGALLLLVLMQTWIVKRSLRPLRDTRRELRALKHGDLERLSLRVPDEVRPVVAEVNDLLDVLNRRLERSRKALGNLTHALKTPLTLMTDIAHRPQPLGVEQLQSELDTQVETMRRLMERELHRARLAGSIGSGQAFVAEAEIPPLVDALQRMYQHKPVAIKVRVPDGLRCGIEQQDLIELLGNLLDNACKWSHGRVRLTLAADHDTRLVIEDDGPGLAPEQVEGLTGRGTRLDEHSPGHGLGLGIVQDIVDAYDGEIQFGRSQALGGLQVEVRLQVFRCELALADT